MVGLLLPIILSILLGYFLYNKKFLSDEMISAFKKIVINVTLPAALLSSFIKIRFRPEFIIVFISVFVSCVALLLIGKGIAKIFSIKSKYFPFLLTGFEAGMLGYALYTSVYGADSAGTFGVVDVGQVSFVFLILVPLVLLLSNDRKSSGKIAQSLKIAIKSPVIWAIVIGLLGSILKVFNYSEHIVFININSVLAFISAPTTLLICLVIGSGLKFSFKGKKLEVFTCIIRLVLTMSFAFILKYLVFIPLHLEAQYIKALFIMFVLPGAFVIPAFMQGASQEDINYVSNTLSLGTLFSLVGFVIIILI